MEDRAMTDEEIIERDKNMKQRRTKMILKKDIIIPGGIGDDTFRA